MATTCERPGSTNLPRCRLNCSYISDKKIGAALDDKQCVENAALSLPRPLCYAKQSAEKLVNVRQHLSDCWPVFLIEGSLLSISVFVRKNNIRFLEEREKKKKKDLSLKISKRINYNKNWNETLKSFHKNNICNSSKKKKKEKEEAALELDPDRELGKYRGKLITTKTGTKP